MGKGQEVTAFKEKTLVPQSKAAEKEWDDAIKDGTKSLNDWKKVLKKEEGDTDKKLKLLQTQLKKEQASIVDNGKRLKKAEKELEEAQQAEQEISEDEGDDETELLLKEVVKQIDEHGQLCDKLEFAISRSQGTVKRLEKDIKGVEEKLEQVREKLNEQESEHYFELDEVDLGDLRDSIGTHFWSSQVFKDFQKEHRKVAAKVQDYTQLIKGLKAQPLPYKESLSYGIRFMGQVLDTLFEAGKQAFESSLELAEEESLEEAELSSKGKIVPPVVIFRFPNAKQLLLDLGLKKAEVDRLPIKGDFACIIGDKEARVEIASRGLAPIELAKAGEAAAVSEMKIYLLKKARDLLSKLDDGTIDETKATKLWRDYVGALEEIAVGAALTELERQFRLAKLSALATVKFALSVAGKVLSTVGSTIGAVMSALVGNVAGLIVGVIAAIKSVTSLILEVKQYCLSLVKAVEKAGTELESVLKKFNVKKNEISLAVKGKLKTSDGAKALTSKFFNDLIGFPIFTTLGDLSDSVTSARDKMNKLEVSQTNASREQDTALQQQEAMMGELKKLLALKDVPEEAEEKIAELRDSIETLSDKIGELSSSIIEQSGVVTDIGKELKRLEDATAKLKALKPGVKWLELTGQLLALGASIAAGQLTASPTDLLQQLDAGAKIANDVLSYSGTASSGCSTLLGLARDYV